jgi:hypothetical protein
MGRTNGRYFTVILRGLGGLCCAPFCGRLSSMQASLRQS